jgi:hypothetical protein
LPSFATISFTRFCCGLFLIHSIRFDLIALTVDVRDGSQFADVRHDDLITKLLPLLARPDRNPFPPPSRRVPEAPENLVSPFFVTWLKGFVANSEVAHNSRLAIRKSTVILLGVEECLRQFGCTKHIRDAL